MGITQIPTALATIYSPMERYWAGIKDRSGERQAHWPAARQLAPPPRRHLTIRFRRNKRDDSSIKQIYERALLTRISARRLRKQQVARGLLTPFKRKRRCIGSIMSIRLSRTTRTWHFRCRFRSVPTTLGKEIWRTTPFIYSVSDLPVPSSRTGLYLCSSRGLGRQPNRRSRPGVWVSERSIVTNSLSPREWRCGETVLLAGIKPRPRRLAVIRYGNNGAAACRRIFCPTN